MDLGFDLDDWALADSVSGSGSDILMNLPSGPRGRCPRFRPRRMEDLDRGDSLVYTYFVLLLGGSVLDPLYDR